jgi:hypothetical protein
MRLRQLFAGVLCASVLALVAAPGVATAASTEKTGAGHTFNGQMGGKHDLWLGQYIVNGKPVFCVDYALKAPGQDDPVKRGGPVTTKWGGKLPAGQASDMSYLLLKYGTTKNSDIAVAVADLLHTWTAPLIKGKSYTAKNAKDRAYNAAYYEKQMSSAQKQAVRKLRAEAAKNRAPWQVSLTPPARPQLNKAAPWKLKLVSGKGTPVSGIPVKLAAKSATIAGSHDATVKTDENGAATAKVLPTGKNPSVTASLHSPNALPHFQLPKDDPKGQVQKVVVGGGEQNLTTTVQIKPGAVQVSKLDASTNKGIEGVSLRITGNDKKSPAVNFQGKPLLGADKKPAVVQTGSGGTVSVPDLAAPQEICVVETAAAAGYEFDENKPASACGSLQPGQTLALKLTNKAKQVIVPIHIPAGQSPPNAVANAAVVTRPAPLGLFGLGAGVLVFGAVGTVFVRRAARKQ